MMRRTVPPAVAVPVTHQHRVIGADDGAAIVHGCWSAEKARRQGRARAQSENCRTFTLSFHLLLLVGAGAAGPHCFR